MGDDALIRTRRSWHGLAELVLAGPQYRRSGTIRLRITPGGFATIKDPELRVAGDHLLAGDRRLAVAGQTYAGLAEQVGVVVGRPEGLYADGSGADPDDPIDLSSEAVQRLAEAFGRGDAALRAFAPSQTPVLWPEHFDVGVTVDEVNYGLSPGDSYLAEPYAYVGPHRAAEGLGGSFWNAPFGAARSLRELSDVDAVVRFFTDGRAAAGGGSTAPH
jgi:hypothetical protein